MIKKTKIMKYIILLFSLLMGVYPTLNAQKEMRQKNKSASNGYKIGDTVEDFELKNVNGKMVSLASMGKVEGYIVVFTSNMCPFAVGSEDRLIQLHETMAPKGYPVIAINSNDSSMESGDSFEAMIERHQEKGYPFVYLKDESSVYQRFGANKTPHVFLLDKEKKVQYIGSMDDSPREADEVTERYVVNAIAALENGNDPDPAVTKAIGCPIKAKGSKGGRMGRKGRKGRQGPPNPEEIMEEMDSNKDGKISNSEAAGPLTRDFDRLDKNRDGYLTSEELSNIGKRRKR